MTQSSRQPCLSWCGNASPVQLVALFVEFFTATCRSAVVTARAVALLRWVAALLALVWMILLAWRMPWPEVVDLVAGLLS